MATAEELLASLAGSEDKICVIDNDLRTIKIPKTITALGVESDDEVHRLNFQMPRYLGDTDLSAFSIRINYLNANNESDIYAVLDKQTDNTTITFSWLIGRHAFAYKGNVKFIVCLKEADSDTGEVLREYNTTIATLPVLEGLEVDAAPIEGDLLDILAQLESVGSASTAALRNTATKQMDAIKETSETEQQNIKDTADYIRSTFGDDYDVTVKQYRTRANAITETAQGESIVADDASDDYLRSLKIFGKTTQVVTTGKNLLNVSDDNAIYLDGYKNYTISNRTVSVTGLSFFIFKMPVVYGATYAISLNKQATDSTCHFRVYEYSAEPTAIADDDEKYIGIPINSACAGLTTVTKLYTPSTEDVTWVGIGFYTTQQNIISNVQAEVGTEATAYEPYSGGVVSPSPDWARELTSIEEPTIDLLGKNLIQNTLGTATNSGITYTRNEDGSITLNGTATDNSYYTFDFGNPIPAHNVEMILSIEGGAGLTSISLGYFRANGTIKNAIVYAEDNSATFVYPDEAALTRTFLTVTTGKTCDNLVVRPMVRLAALNDTFEAAKEKQSMSLPYTLNGVPVTANGNYTDASGQQWICDEIDFERGVYIQRCKTETLTFEPDVTDYGTRYVCYGVSVTPHQLCTVCMCPQLAYSPNVGLTGPYVDNGIRITPTYRGGTVVARWDDHVIESLTVTYLRETPLETALTDTELAAYASLHTNYPNTVVLNDAGAHMELKYNADTQTYLENCYRPTNDQVQASVDTWLASHYTEAEGVSF